MGINVPLNPRRNVAMCSVAAQVVKESADTSCEFRANEEIDQERDDCGNISRINNKVEWNMEIMDINC